MTEHGHEVDMAASSEKLEKCEVCDADKAKYTCPKCEVRTCSLPCVNIHKKELECDGIRDKTKFVPLNQFTNLDLLSDYRLLEDIGRSVELLQKNPLKKCTRLTNLPNYLQVLRKAAYHRGVNLEFMPQHFSRHKENTTFLNYKDNELFWKVEFIFPHAENVKWSIKRVSDTKRLSVVLEELLNPDISSNSEDGDYSNKLAILREKLKYYRAHGLSGLRALLKAEKVQKSDSRFYELDLTSSIRENLKNKTIIEFPTIYVAYTDHSDMFEILDSDEEEEMKPKITKTRRGKRKFSDSNKRDKQEETPKAEIDSSNNYFFNTEVTDSEDEDSEGVKHQNRNNQELFIPDYNELVKM